MEIKDRIQELRKYLKLSQKEFGEKINLTTSSISLLENGNRNVTDRVIDDICSTFKVSEEWLRDGIGEMFIEYEDDLIESLGMELNNLDDVDKKILISYLKMTPQEREGLKTFLMKMFKT